MRELSAREAQLLHRQWLIERMQALTAAMDALPQPANPVPPVDQAERTPAAPAALVAYHEAVERYCAAWDALQAQFTVYARELLADLVSEPEPNAAQLRFVAAFDQWQQHVTDAYQEDAALTASTRGRVAAARLASRRHEEGKQVTG